jgi:SPP1 gp7 family putative phage head morphogenesis protein
MIIEADAVINAEILFEQQAIEDTSIEAFKELLLKITSLLQAGEPLKKIKKLIENSDVNKNLSKDLQKVIKQQLENITGEQAKINLEEAVIAGYTHKELIEQRKNTTKKQAIKYMTQAEDVLKDEKRKISQLVQDEINKYEKSIETFYRTQTKSARETGYAQNEKVLSKEIKGWISIAVLDNKTSAICLSLHNQFYEKNDVYKTRFDLPYQIPRHPNCRSMFVAVFKGKSIQSYKGKNLETFLMNNETAGKDLLGIKKYELFKNKDIKLTNFVDLKGKRFYTNSEIKKRLNIKD